MSNNKKEKLFTINENIFQNITSEDFDDVIFDSDKPALVLFGAERCRVCKEIQPSLEDILPKYMGKLNSYFVDVDNCDDLMKRFRLKGIPTILIFNEGEVRARTAGMRTDDELIELIELALE